MTIVLNTLETDKQASQIESMLEDWSTDVTGLGRHSADCGWVLQEKKCHLLHYRGG